MGVAFEHLSDGGECREGGGCLKRRVMVARYTFPSCVSSDGGVRCQTIAVFSF